MEKGGSNQVVVSPHTGSTELLVRDGRPRPGPSQCANLPIFTIQENKLKSFSFLSLICLRIFPPNIPTKAFCPPMGFLFVCSENCFYTSLGV